MSAGKRHLVGAAAAACLLVLALPSGALASKCNASACKVYVEQDGPTAGRGLGPRPGPDVGQAPTSKNLERVLAQAGADKDALSNLLTESGGTGTLAAGDDTTGPGLLGAVLDLGAGPLALLAILLATAVGLASRGPVRGWFRARFSSSSS